MESILTRERAKVLPRLPTDASKYAEILSNYVPSQTIYKGEVRSQDGGVANLFSTDKLKNYLNEAILISIDGTFAVIILHINIFLPHVHLKLRFTLLRNENESFC